MLAIWGNFEHGFGAQLAKIIQNAYPQTFNLQVAGSSPAVRAPSCQFSAVFAVPFFGLKTTFWLVVSFFD